MHLADFQSRHRKGKETGISALCRVALVVSMVGRLDLSTMLAISATSCIAMRISTLGRADL